ncbi:MAG: hypothetical protein ACFB51_09410, partial [Anaerolineae bacterium]
MTAQLRRLIAPPQFDDDLKNRTAVSLTIILYALFIGSLAGLIIVVFSTTGTLAEVVALGVMLALMITFVALLKAGRVSLVSQLVPLIAFALIVLLVLSGIMGIRDIS